jgi:transketolase
MKYLVPFNENYNKDLDATHDGFGTGLVKLAKINNNVVGLCADLTESTRMDGFAKQFPERFFEVGVAEQNLAGLSAGLALSGKVPFMASYAVFSPGRNWDQIRVSICYSKANVKIVGAHAGLSVGADGASHQALEDIAMMRVLPNIIVVVPADDIEAEKATIAIGEHTGPSYIRLGREKVPSISRTDTQFKLGKANQILSGNDVTIIACGQMVARAVTAAKKLDGKLSVGVINMHTIKPIDKQAIIEAAKTSGAIVTAEEHQIIGGLGSAVAEVLSENHQVPLVRVGVHDHFGESGAPDILMEHYGLGVDDIIEAVNEVIKKKNARKS